MVSFPSANAMPGMPALWEYAILCFHKIHKNKSTVEPGREADSQLWATLSEIILSSCLQTHGRSGQGRES